MTEDYRHALQISNYVFTGLFVLEMAIKLTAEGPVRYFWDPFNTFDAIVVALSVLEILLTIFGGGLINLSPLRTLRLARAFKLARSFQGLRRIINTLIACMTQVRRLPSPDGARARARPVRAHTGPSHPLPPCNRLATSPSSSSFSSLSSRCWAWRYLADRSAPAT